MNTYSKDAAGTPYNQADSYDNQADSYSSDKAEPENALITQTDLHKRQTQPKKIRLKAAAFEIMLNTAKGFAMGAADVVPGVSGGTMALVLGIYERLLNSASLASTAAGWLARCHIRKAWQSIRSVQWLLVLPLACGIGIAVISLASVIKTQLAVHPTEIAGMFCGLVVASIVISCRLFEWRKATKLAIIFAVAVISFVLLGFQATPATHPHIIAFFAAGAIAVCAMILPGISGSFVLLMLGMYSSVIEAVDERIFGSAFAFIAGAVTGLSVFTVMLGRLMHRARDTVIAALVGLMIGSLRVLWPWPNGVGSETSATTDTRTRKVVSDSIVSDATEQTISGVALAWPESDEWFMPSLAALIGFALVILLHWLSETGFQKNSRITTKLVNHGKKSR